MEFECRCRVCGFSDCSEIRVRALPCPSSGTRSSLPKHCPRFYTNTSFHQHASWPHAILYISEIRIRINCEMPQLNGNFDRPTCCSYLRAVISAELTYNGHINPDFWLARLAASDACQQHRKPDTRPHRPTAPRVRPDRGSRTTPAVWVCQP